MLTPVATAEFADDGVAGTAGTFDNFCSAPNDRLPGVIGLGMSLPVVILRPGVVGLRGSGAEACFSASKSALSFAFSSTSFVDDCVGLKYLGIPVGVPSLRLLPPGVVGRDSGDEDSDIPDLKNFYAITTQ